MSEELSKYHPWENEGITELAYFKKRFLERSQEVARLESRLRKVEECLKSLAECPYTPDQASIPKAGIDARPEQVVGVMSVGYLKWSKLQSLTKGKD